MKRSLSFVLLLAVLVTGACIAGCTTNAPQSVPTTTPAVGAPPATPNLIGTWTGTMKGYDASIGFTDYVNSTLSMVVTGQQGRLFNGNLLFQVNSTTAYTVPMAGVIGSDGRTFSIVEDTNGYTTGEITGNGEIQLTHMSDHKPFDVALDTLKRS